MNTNPPRTWRRRLLRGVYYLAALITLLALAGTVAGWWARRHWREVKAELTASGRLLPLEKLIPPPIPDDENFAAIPILRPQWEEIARKRSGSELAEVSKFELLPEFDLKKPGQQYANLALDYSKWEVPVLTPALEGSRLGPMQPGETPAAGVLRGLANLDAPMRAIAEGVRRPGCRFPIRYEEHYAAVMPQAIGFRRIAVVFALRATARLESNDAPGAAEDIVTLLRLGAHFRRDPSLLRLILGAGIEQLATWHIWYGCVQRAWTPTHLAAFERELGSIDLFHDMPRVLQLETASSIAVFESASQSWSSQREVSSLVRALSERTVNVFFGEAAFTVGMCDLARTGADLAQSLPAERPSRFEPAALLKVLAALNDEHRPWTRWISAMAIPSYDRTLYRIVEIQARLELCLAAVRLERARLAAGRYPASLDGLEIPNDFNAGAALRYEVAPDGSRFRLLGQGWKLKTMQDRTPSPWSWYSNVGGPAQWD